MTWMMFPLGLIKVAIFEPILIQPLTSLQTKGRRKKKKTLYSMRSLSLKRALSKEDSKFSTIS